MVNVWDVKFSKQRDQRRVLFFFFFFFFFLRVEDKLYFKYIDHSLEKFMCHTLTINIVTNLSGNSFKCLEDQSKGWSSSSSNKVLAYLQLLLIQVIIGAFTE